MESIATLEKMIQVSGGEIYVKLWRPELLNLSVPVVLLHDSLGCTAMWREFPAQLSERLGRTDLAGLNRSR